MDGVGRSPRIDALLDFIDRAWSKGDPGAIEEHIAERYTIAHDPGDPWEGQTLTREGFRDRLLQSRATAPDQAFTVVGAIEQGDEVAVWWTWRGTHLGELPGLPATGASITMSGATIYRFDGMRIAGHWQVADRLSVYRQVMAASRAADASSL
ncbi:ester cyclase [Acuticoccus sp. M5D2P5]|uniref:ester cyclase n=1 Tax=Acuticoccus kalidii TaxID=2910977 RepID=UPI001F443FFE|nr:ester cyclase [Acuticoccus kalidii]MCF3935408.1 ester cyclase [Acuticoccus kalidii]